MTHRTTLLQILNAIHREALSESDQLLLDSFRRTADHASPQSIVIPPIIDTRNVNGATVFLYADGSVATDAFNAWAAQYTGPNERCYGLFCDDTVAVFGLTQQNNPVAYGNCQANRANTHGPMAQMYPWSKGGVMQGVQGTTNPDGHGFVGTPSALRGTLATRLNIADIDAVMLPAWKAANPPYYPTQIDGATAGNFYGNVAS